MRRVLWFLCAAVIPFAAGCGDKEAAPATSPAPTVFTEHRFESAPTLTTADARRGLGADCSRHGAASCSSGLCIHTGARPGDGHVCSRTCVGHEECPRNWNCVQTHPTAEARICVPPLGGQP